ncbi:hypothetical protein [Burkholderia contaminans]|uniref:DNA-binding protein n=1 Tax=Burkholderia contaminans TaxID=488447 RepID=A0A6P2YCJ3_9BURK|nr:hypothetical protein [Burkholderia contaminans]VWD17169.1 hypothetical protein BCO71171_02932 [Burkholderia contaminans]
MNAVTPRDRVTPGLTSRTENPPKIVGKKALCARLGWSRPALDRRLRCDASFPVLHCGKQGEPWQFDLPAVIAYLEAPSSSPRSSKSVRPRRLPMSSEAGSDLSHDLAHARALHHIIAERVAELGATLGRIASAIEPDAASLRSDAPAANVENEHDD